MLIGGALLTAALATLEGAALSSFFLLALFAGVCVLFGLPRLRARRRDSRVVRSLDEALGRPQRYLSPDAPRGTADPLHPMELPVPSGRLAE